MNFNWKAASAKLANGWSVEIMNVTPDVARAMLEQNTDNRRVRPSVVARYAAIMSAGNWKLSPDGIVFSDKRLLQGQHRLSAVIAADVAVDLMVWTGVDDEVFRVFDRGATRSTADAIGRDVKLVQVANFVCSAMYPSGRFIVDEESEAVCDLIEDYYNFLMGGTTTRVSLFSSAPFKAAAILRMAAGEDAEYIRDVYKNMVLSNIADLPRVAQNFVGSYAAKGLNIGGVAGRERQLALFAKAWTLFDKEKANNNKVIVRNPDIALSELRKIIKNMESL
jgi:hypothetical protein